MKITQDRIRFLNESFDKVVAHYGFSKFYSWVPYFLIFYDPHDEFYGEFDRWEQDISINLYHHSTERQCILTIIHEYAHYLQSPTWYVRYSSMYSYRKHPYEIEAEKIAYRDIHLFTDKKR